MRKAVESVTDIVFPVSKSATNLPQQHLVERGRQNIRERELLNFCQITPDLGTVYTLFTCRFSVMHRPVS